MSDVKVSVVMATYNGIKYLKSQLDSIRCQTYSPNEVLIFDDCSTDGLTADFISSYIKSFSLKNWKLVKNAKNVGWKKNFINALLTVDGDFVFLADQDDIWKEDKVEKMVRCLVENPQISLLCSNYDVVNESHKSVKNQCSLNDGKLRKIELSPKFHLVGRPGCTYCIKVDFARKTSQAWIENEAHDKLLWNAAVITGGLFCLHEPLISFRRHCDNASGKGHVADKKKRMNLQLQDLFVYKRLKNVFGDVWPSKSSNNGLLLKKYEMWCESRIRLLGKKNIRDSIYCFVNKAFYSSLLSYFADVLE